MKYEDFGSAVIILLMVNHSAKVKLNLAYSSTDTGVVIINIIRKYVLPPILYFVSLSALSAEQVYFAGLSFIGDYKDMVSAAPYASSIIKNKKALASYNSLIRDALYKVEDDSVTFEFGLGNSKSGNALALSIAITEEQFQVEDTGNGYFAVKATTFGQIVLFDFTRKRIISTIPFATTYTDSPTAVTEEYRSEIYKVVYYDQSKKINLVNEFLVRLKEINYKKPFNNFNIQVRDISHTASAEKYFQRFQVDKKVFNTRLASQFGSYFSKALRVPVLPYTKGQAIGGAMAMRFENADSVMFELPKADFYVDLKLLGFNKKILKETDHVIYPSYISGLRISIGDVSWGDLLFSEKAQSGRVLTLSKALKVDEWNEYQNSLSSLAAEFSEQLNKPDKKWVKEKMFTKKSFKKIKKIVERLENRVFSNLR